MAVIPSPMTAPINCPATNESKPPNKHMIMEATIPTLMRVSAATMRKPRANVLKMRPDKPNKATMLSVAGKLTEMFS